MREKETKGKRKRRREEMGEVKGGKGKVKERRDREGG